MNKNDIKAIFVDIDNTLYDHRYKTGFDEKSIKALNNVREQGIKVFLCTSRPIYSIKAFKIFDLLKCDGLIASNGAVRVINNEWITPYTFPKRDLKNILDVCTKYKLCLEMVTFDDRFYATPKTDLVDLHHQEFYEPDAEYIPYQNQEVISLLMFAPKEVDETLKKELPEGIFYLRFGSYGVDLVMHNHNKGEGVLAIREHLKLKKEECIAFGDDYQDIAMFNEVGYGVAVGNAKEKLKEQAFFVTKAVNKHGVYYFLKKNHFIKTIFGYIK